MFSLTNDLIRGCDECCLVIMSGDGLLTRAALCRCFECTAIFLLQSKYFWCALQYFYCRVVNIFTSGHMSHAWLWKWVIHLISAQLSISSGHWSLVTSCQVSLQTGHLLSQISGTGTYYCHCAMMVEVEGIIFSWMVQMRNAMSGSGGWPVSALPGYLRRTERCPAWCSGPHSTRRLLQSPSSRHLSTVHYTAPRYLVLCVMLTTIM